MVRVVCLQPKIETVLEFKKFVHFAICLFLLANRNLTFGFIFKNFQFLLSVLFCLPIVVSTSEIFTKT